MYNNQKLKSFICSIMVSLMLCSTVMAAPAAKDIKAILNAVTIKVNSKAIKSNTIYYNNVAYVQIGRAHV